MSGTITNLQPAIAEIKQKLDIVTVVESYVKLRKAGKNYSGLCPFHTEKTPSFIVSPDIQLYKCFGCGKSGDLISFIQEIESLEFIESIKKLADMSGVTLQTEVVFDKWAPVKTINNIAADFFFSEMKKSDSAIKYIKERGFTRDEVLNFKIGYAPGRNQLLSHIQSKHKIRDKSNLADTGLFSINKGIVKDRFINRLMFPLKNKYGELVGFSGRQMPGDDFGPKYLNTPETPLFHKREMLYGYYEAKNSIRKEDLCIVCEGQIDVISAHKVGIKNIVAPLGTALTTEQIELISTLTQNILFIFDNDSAGYKALERAFEITNQLGISPLAQITAPYKDLDELIIAKPNSIQTLINKPKDAYTVILSNMLSDYNPNDLPSRNKLLRYHIKLMESVKSENDESYYNNKFSKLTGLSIKHSTKPTRINRNEGKKPITKVTANLKDIEVYLIAQIIKHELFDSIPTLDTTLFTNQTIINILNKAKTVSHVTYKFLTEGPFEEGERLFLEDLVFQSHTLLSLENPQGEIESILKRLRASHSARNLRKFRAELALAEEKGDKEAIKKWLQQISQFNK